MTMIRSWYVLVALSIGVAGGGAGYAEADPLSIVIIQAAGPFGTQDASGATQASITLNGFSFAENLNTVTAKIDQTHGLALTDIPNGPGSLIFDVIRISTQVTLSDPHFPDCVSPTFGAPCNFQAGTLFLTLAGTSTGSGRVGGSAHGSTGLDSTGQIILFGIDFDQGGPTGPFNPPVGPGNLLGDILYFLPSGTYFLDIQLNVSVFGVGSADFSNSFHDFVEVADGVTFSEATGLLPLGPPSPAPEPETYALVLAGLGALGFVARRRKQNEAAAA
jgi:PEP-CTERM motif